MAEPESRLTEGRSFFEVAQFEYLGHAMRATLIDGWPWFLAVDACRVVGWDLVRAMKALPRLDRIHIHQRYLGAGKTALHPTGEHEGAWFTSEAGLYQIAFRMGDEPFQYWVTHQLVPSVIRMGLSSTAASGLTATVRRVEVDNKATLMRKRLANRVTHHLYRFFDDHGVLLYVGISWQVAQRVSKHRSTKPWWHKVKTVTLEQYPSREEVLVSELQAIRTEHPRYNVRDSVPEAC